MLSAFLCTYLLSSLYSVVTAAQSEPQVSTKFPWVNKFASIGDSYAAGLGAGPRIDFLCSRYGHSYPNLLQSSLLGENPNRTHQFLACSGATSTMILKDQVPSLEQDLDLLTISAGGNDIGLTPILNNCVYQFQMAKAGDCTTAIENARKNIADKAQLYKNITLLIDAAKPKMNKTHGIIYLAGYASFFGVEDHICDNVTWSVWRDVETDKQYLKLEMRKQLNEMVRSVNDVLHQATDDAGPSVRFIDYNKLIEQGRGRYCESGIHEPAPNRLGLAFYEWDTADEGENVTELRRTGDDVPKGSFEGSIAVRINKTLQEHPDWEFDTEKGYVNKSKIRPDGVVDDIVWWLLPDSWKRVFHLRPEAHAVIAQLVVEDLQRNKRDRQGGLMLLLRNASVGAGIVIGILLILALIWRRRKSKYALLKNKSDEPLDESDTETLADPDENDAPKTRTYNTFD